MTFRSLSWIALIGAISALALGLARLNYGVSFSEPLQMITSGDEQASLFAIWKAVQGHAVYADRFQAPFALYSYNWLFAHLYGAVVGFVSTALQLNDAWLPTIARLITVSGACWIVFAAYRSFTDTLPAGLSDHRRYWVALSVLLAFGPLGGFWILTTRPDIWALAFEITGAWLFLRLYGRNRIGALAAVVVMAYLAWALKQTAVMFGGTAGMFLLVRRDWTLAGALAAAMIAAWAATFAVAGPDYATAIFFGDAPLNYEISRGIRNALNAGGKIIPVLAGVAALAVVFLSSPALRRAAFANDTMLFASLGVILTASLSLPASTQTGASENYFFTLAYFLSLALVSGISILHRHGTALPKVFHALSAAGWGVLMIAVVMVFSGIRGVISVHGQHTSYMAQKVCLDRMPRPLFVNDRYLSLPWMTPGNQPYVLSYLYERERLLDRPFEDGGIGGRIAAGHFASLAIGAGKIPQRVDGASLDGYGRAPYSCPGLMVLLRK